MSREGGGMSSSSALVRISVNPDCDLVAGMALDQQSEEDTYFQVTGHRYEGEYGIRLSLMRRGNKFENNNHINDAAALRKRVAEAFDFPNHDPESVLVRDLDTEEPTNGGDVRTGNLVRYKKTKQVVLDAYRQKQDMPHLVIHPTLKLPLLKGVDGKPLARGARYINPDFMVLVPGSFTYLIGDEKSFIVRDDTVVEGRKLNQVRRQIAAGTLAMRAELQSIKGVDARHTRKTGGLLVFASPFGLSASRIVLEDLSGEIAQIEKAIPQMQRVAVVLAQIRSRGLHQFSAITPLLDTSLRESCYGNCLLVDYCEKLPQNQPVALGRDVHRLLGGKTVTEIADLADRRRTLAPREAYLIDSIEQVANVLGLDLVTYLTEVA